MELLNKVPNTTSTLHDWLSVNRGIFAVELNCKSILRHFPFTDETANLKVAVEKSIEECLATWVVDSLLKCDKSVLVEFIKVLYLTNQAKLVHKFQGMGTEGMAYPAQVLQEYTSMHHCETSIPLETKHRLQLNYEQITKVISNGSVMETCGTYLSDKKAISKQTFNKCFNAYIYGDNIGMFIDIIINANEYQFEKLKEYAETQCPKLLKYL